MDLTCSLPIITVLIDDQNRNFDPIEGLYKVKDNPECNASLQPGFAEDMTWVYRVPTNTHVLGWAFEDTTDFPRSGATSQRWSVFRFQELEYLGGKQC